MAILSFYLARGWQSCPGWLSWPGWLRRSGGRIRFTMAHDGLTPTRLTWFHESQESQRLRGCARVPGGRLLMGLADSRLSATQAIDQQAHASVEVSSRWGTGPRRHRAPRCAIDRRRRADGRQGAPTCHPGSPHSHSLQEVNAHEGLGASRGRPEGDRKRSGKWSRSPALAGPRIHSQEDRPGEPAREDSYPH